MYKIKGDLLPNWKQAGEPCPCGGRFFGRYVERTTLTHAQCSHCRERREIPHNEGWYLVGGRKADPKQAEYLLKLGARSA